MPSNHVLYAAPLSYFSGKARSYLHYKQVGFEERFADRNVYQDIILPRIGYPVMPVTILDNDQAIQDTSELIDYFENTSHSPSATPPTPKQAFVSALLELYGDEWLVIPAMHYRWVYNKDFALSEFGKVTAPHAPKAEQLKAAEKSSAMFQAVVPMLGATPQMAPAIEKSYINFLHEFNTHLEHHDFLLGGKPCTGDFGLVGPLYAHLYRDPFSGDLMKKEAPLVAKWVERMIAIPFNVEGDYLANDEIPPTLYPLLKRQMSEQGPCLLDLVEKLADFKTTNKDQAIPRTIGMHDFTVEGETGKRIIIPYTQWMLQRALTPLSKLDDKDRTKIDNLLNDINGQTLKGLTIKAPVTRENHKLIWA